MKRYDLVLVRDDIDGGCFVADSKHNPMFFENIRNYSNCKYYTLLSKVITVNEEELDDATMRLASIANMDITDLEKKKKAISVWAHFDFNFKHLTKEEKENIVNDYIDAYFNS